MADNIIFWMSKAHKDVKEMQQYYNFKQYTCNPKLFEQSLIASLFITDDGNRTIVIKINGDIKVFDSKGASLPIHDITSPFVSFFNDAYLTY
ncbi:TPA: hypothetical protein ACX6QL_002038 [Photobacterium damselae]